MSISKKVILFLIGLLFFPPFHFAFAGLVINEIMYDLSGADSTSSKSREWIEVYNNGASDVAIDASTWRVYDGSANRTINGEVDFSISAGSYVIFAGDKDTFLADHSGFSGTVYDTGITSLNNTGATLKILDQDGNVVDSVIYASSQGGAGDGNTLQKISSVWSGATPTPGATNESVAPSSSGGSTGGGSGGGSSSTAQETTSKIPELKKIKTQVIGNTLAFAGLPFYFQAVSYGHNGEQLYHGKYFWNFGDGDSQEVKSNDVGKFTHTYFYPGEYIVSLEYFINQYSTIPDAVDKMTIKVVEMEFLISGVGDEKDFFVELTNNTNYDADISKWILAGSSQSFVFPKNTVLASKKKIIFSPKITGLSIADRDSLKLLNMRGELIFDYPSSFPPPVLAKVEKSRISASQDSATAKPLEGMFLPETQTPVSNLSASVIQNDIAKDNPDNMYMIIISLISIIFIGISAGLVYFVRQRKAVPGAGDDFNILDE